MGGPASVEGSLLTGGTEDYVNITVVDEICRPKVETLEKRPPRVSSSVNRRRRRGERQGRLVALP